MKVGDLVRMRSFRSYPFVSGQGYVDFSAPDGGTRKRDEKMVYGFLLLGVEPLVAEGRDSELLDAELVLNQLGWVMDPERATKALEEKRK